MFCQRVLRAPHACARACGALRLRRGVRAQAEDAEAKAADEAAELQEFMEQESGFKTQSKTKVFSYEGKGVPPPLHKTSCSVNRAGCRACCASCALRHSLA